MLRAASAAPAAGQAGSDCGLVEEEKEALTTAPASARRRNWASCPARDTGAIRGVLNAVDCYARHFAQSGYERLTASQSPFQLWLTTLLVIYVAVLGYRMLFGAGGQRASELPLTGLKIGAVLALTANWATFQTLVFDLASRAPIEIARLATAPSGGLGAGLVGAP